MSDNQGLITAFVLNGKGGGVRVGWEKIYKQAPENGLLWVHLDFTKPNAQKWIRQASQLSEVVQDALLAERDPTHGFLQSMTGC